MTAFNMTTMKVKQLPEAPCVCLCSLKLLDPALVNVNVRLVDRSLQGLFTVNRLNGIGPNACEGAHGCRHTIHV